MAVPEIETRVTALEAEVAGLKKRVEKAVPSQGDWLDNIYGAFANDPDFEEAMRLGREYRESLRPKARRKPTRKSAKKDAKKSVKLVSVEIAKVGSKSTKGGSGLWQSLRPL